MLERANPGARQLRRVQDVMMENLIEKLAANPYAIVAGLLLSGIPVLVPIFKGLYRGVVFVLGISKVGLSRQRARARVRLIRQAIEIASIDRLLEYIFYQTGKMIILATANIMYMIFVLIYLSEKYQGSVPDPVWSVYSWNSILFIGIFATILTSLVLSHQLVRSMRVIRTRRVFIQRKSRRQR